MSNEKTYTGKDAHYKSDDQLKEIEKSPDTSLSEKQAATEELSQRDYDHERMMRDGK